MREILFRGKRIDNGEWIYGDLLTGTDNFDCYEISENTSMGDRYEIIPETIGQYTGLKDKNGTKIFEGDILAKQIFGDIRALGVVKYGEGTFDSGIYKYTGFFYEHPANCSHDHTSIAQSDLLEDSVIVIGNIHDIL